MNNPLLKFGRVGVLMGGYSSEREISLKSGKAIYQALNEMGACVAALDIVEREEDRILSFLEEAHLDTALIALHGRLGEDGTIQTLLNKLDIPYPGSGPQACHLAFNKALSQELFKKRGLKVPHTRVLTKNNHIDVDEIEEEFEGFPVIVKPACEGSSIGITLVRNKNEISPALRLAWEYGESLLVQEFISGRELTVGILEEKPLPVVEIRPQEAFFDFASKYQQGRSQVLVPAPLNKNDSSLVSRVALDAHQLLGCRDLSRVDFILDSAGQYHILEVNTIPGFTSMSLLPKAAELVHLPFPRLCVKLLELAYVKKKENQRIACAY